MTKNVEKNGQTHINIWGRVRGSRIGRCALSAGAVLLGASLAGAQVTNTPAAVLSTISSNSATAFDTFISIFVATLAIGMVIYFARRGASAKH